MPNMQTPRDHAISIGGVETAKLAGPTKEQDQPAQRQKDNVAGMSENERYLFDKMPRQTPPKPYR